MCGISGIVFKQAVSCKEAHQKIGAMSRAIAHRGPDGDGALIWHNAQQFTVYHKPNLQVHPGLQWTILEPQTDSTPAQLALAHRRLSILDLSDAGFQPMFDSQTQNWIIFNGEIFNFQELRSKLCEQGHTFYSQTDTEVILKAYHTWGPDCIAQLQGFFAIVILDNARQKLVMARDYIGIKPLYWTQNPDFFAFASEPKALQTLPIDRGINPLVVFEYLANSRIDVTEQHWLSSVLELKPGHILEYNLKNHSAEIYAYFTPPPSSPHPILTPDPIATFKDMMAQSVRQRLLADVPIGFALSGGLDSTVLLYEAALQNTSPLNTFSSVSNSTLHDESPWQNLVVNDLKTHHHSQTIDPACFATDIPKLIEIQDTPLLGFNNVAHYQLLKKVQDQGIRVLFNGQGADELLGGYEHYFIQHFSDLNLSGKIHLLKHINNAPISLQNLLKGYVFQTLKTYSKSWLNPKRVLHFRPDLRYLDPAFLETHFDQLTLLRAPYSNLNEAMHHDFYGQKLREMLHWEDRVTMAMGIEARNPFADNPDLAAWCFALPMEYKIHQGWSKYILRQAYSPIIPNAIARRVDKKGYSMPNIQLSQSMQSFWFEVLHDPSAQVATPYINLKKVQQQLQTLSQNSNPEIHQSIFKVTNLILYLNLLKSHTAQ